jgi:Zn-dependent protease
VKRKGERPEPRIAAGFALGGREIAWALLSSALLAAWIGYVMGPIYALAGVFGIFVHELGHVLAINRLGCGPGRIHFVPFLGGAATAKRASPTEFVDVRIALAGPAFGILAALPFFAAHFATGERIWLEGAFFIAIINFLNLAPAPPLDGSKALGPALARIHPQVERAALVLIGALAIAWAVNRGSFILALFIGLGVFGALRRGRPSARKLDNRETGMAVGLYLATAALCFGVLYASVALMGAASPAAALAGFMGF